MWWGRTMCRIVRPPTEAPLRFPSGACHGARPEDPIRCPPRATRERRVKERLNSRSPGAERQGSTNIPFFKFSTIVSAFAKELGALNEARFSAHASSSEKRYRTRTVGRFSVPESLAPPHVRARPRGTAAKSPFYSKKVVENQIWPS